MFKEIKTKEELHAFTEFWNAITDEKGFSKSKVPLEHSKKYIFFKEEMNEFDVKKHNVLGTLELTPYEPDGYTTIEMEFPFSSYDVVSDAKQGTYEIDKLAVSADYRGEGLLEEILLVIHAHCVETEAKQYVMLTDYIFFRGLKSQFRVPIINLLDIRNDLPGKPKGIREGNALVIPSLARFRNEKGEMEPWVNQTVATIYENQKKKVVNR